MVTSAAVSLHLSPPVFTEGSRLSGTFQNKSNPEFIISRGRLTFENAEGVYLPERVEERRWRDDG